MQEYTKVEKIVSGGQTGVDRAALDVALELNIPTGGWCPRGRLAEDGTLDKKYPLTETASSLYQERTRKNVEDSDGTLIISSRRQLTSGTLLTQQLAMRLKKPYLVITPQKTSMDKLEKWLADNSIKVLNVAGPRESTSSGIHRKTFKFLMDFFS